MREGSSEGDWGSSSILLRNGICTYRQCAEREIAGLLADLGAMMMPGAGLS
jgi:hypothetical protein